jgi:hypothetical protein
LLITQDLTGFATIVKSESGANSYTVTRICEGKTPRNIQLKERFVGLIAIRVPAGGGICFEAGCHCLRVTLAKCLIHSTIGHLAHAMDHSMLQTALDPERLSITIAKKWDRRS